MDLVALPPTGPGEWTPVVELGVGPAELFVAVALVYSLAFVYLLDAAGLERHHEGALRVTGSAAAVPLLVAFGGAVVYTSITLL